ncbi:hypothetical protein EXIGLDRAFT_831468 [Exidia glandulosa HHB12029]|uniref:Uncharacterized protein n=1 Tax=Exidia glandulosa HHB12029 TaxID=1314781 RepID=A0A165MNL3_EXIGL|nr:hypothetical protein EXIGLDRAFT_831468 [Exidia glandulosa HHB12029]
MTIVESRQRRHASIASRRRRAEEDIQPGGGDGATDLPGSHTLTLDAGSSGEPTTSTDVTASSSPAGRSGMGSALSIGVTLAVLGALFILMGVAYVILVKGKGRDKTSKSSHPSSSFGTKHIPGSSIAMGTSNFDDARSRYVQSPSPTIYIARTPSPEVIYLDISPSNVPAEFDFEHRDPNGDYDADYDEDDRLPSPMPPAHRRQGMHWMSIQHRWPGSSFAPVLETIPGSPPAIAFNRRKEILSIHSALSLGGLAMPLADSDAGSRRNSRIRDSFAGAAARLSAFVPASPTRSTFNASPTPEPDLHSSQNRQSAYFPPTPTRPTFAPSAEPTPEADSPNDSQRSSTSTYNPGSPSASPEES